VGGAHPSTSDPRCPKVQGITVCGYQTQSIIRVVSYEHDSATLLAYPPAELAGLRNGARSLNFCISGAPPQTPASCVTLDPKWKDR